MVRASGGTVGKELVCGRKGSTFNTVESNRMVGLNPTQPALSGDSKAAV